MPEEKRRLKAVQKLSEILVEATTQKPPPPPQPLSGGWSISGGTVIFGNGTINHNVYHAPRPRITVVQTGNGVLDAPQKRRLLDLRDQIVGVARVLDEHHVTPAMVMRKLNGHMNVNSYAEISADLFDRAETYLVRWRARLEGMPGATKSPGWRDRRIQAIHARCKELRCDRWRLNYMRKVFGKVSMIDLSNDEVGKLYRAVMDRKPGA